MQWCKSGLEQFEGSPGELLGFGSESSLGHFYSTKYHVNSNSCFFYPSRWSYILGLGVNYFFQTHFWSIFSIFFPFGWVMTQRPRLASGLSL